MFLSANQWKLRLQNEYRTMCRLPMNNLISWKIGPNEVPPLVKNYLVTYRNRTLVLNKGRLVPQDKTVVEIRIGDSPNTAPVVRIVEGEVPFHPNWYTNKTLCPGNIWTSGPRLWQYVINIGRTLSFDPACTNPHSPANREAAADWINKMSRNPSTYPCGRLDFPTPVSE